MEDSKSSKKGYLLAAFAAVQWSTMGFLGKVLFSYQTVPLTVVALRASLVTITLLVILVLFRRKWLSIQLQDWGFFAAYGLFGVAAGFYLYFTAVDLTGVAIAAVLLYTYPAFVTLLSVIFLDERITSTKVIALVLSLGGVALVSEFYNPTMSQIDMRGVAVALLSAVAVATHSIFGKKAVQKYSSWTILLYSIGFGALFLVVAQFIFLGTPDLNRPPTFWGLVIALAWIPTLGANLAYISSLARIEASRASITATIEPVFAVVFAYFFFGEILSPTQILGTMLILAGVLVVQR